MKKRRAAAASTSKQPKKVKGTTPPRKAQQDKTSDSKKKKKNVLETQFDEELVVVKKVKRTTPARNAQQDRSSDSTKSKKIILEKQFDEELVVAEDDAKLNKRRSSAAKDKNNLMITKDTSTITDKKDDNDEEDDDSYTLTLDDADQYLSASPNIDDKEKNQSTNMDNVENCHLYKILSNCNNECFQITNSDRFPSLEEVEQTAIFVHNVRASLHTYIDKGAKQGVTAMSKFLVTLVYCAYAIDSSHVVGELSLSRIIAMYESQRNDQKSDVFADKERAGLQSRVLRDSVNNLFPLGKNIRRLLSKKNNDWQGFRHKSIDAPELQIPMIFIGKWITGEIAAENFQGELEEACVAWNAKKSI